MERDSSDSEESTQASGGELPHDAARKVPRTGREFTAQLGRLVMLWGDIEALIRTLEMMKGQRHTFRAKTDAELMKEYRLERRPFDKHVKAVFPYQTAMARGILKLKELRDFALHGAIVKWNDGSGDEDAIIHVDLPATIFAQEAFISRSLEAIVPKQGMLSPDGQAGPSIVMIDGLRRASEKLAGYVYDLRLFRTLFQTKEGSEVRLATESKKLGLADPPRGVGRRGSAISTPRSINASVFQNPADVIGHDQRTALLLGRFCLAFALLDQMIRTLELMRTERSRQFQAHTEPKAEAWYNESTTQLTARLNFVMGKETRDARLLAEVVKFRNFICHHPVSMLGTGRNGDQAAFIHRDLVALRDARPRPDAEKNEVRPVPAWAIEQHTGTTHLLVDELPSRTKEVTAWQNKLVRLIERGHRHPR